MELEQRLEAQLIDSTLGVWLLPYHHKLLGRVKPPHWFLATCFKLIPRLQYFENDYIK